MNTTVEGQVRSFIEDNFLFRGDRADLSAEESLLEAGLIDSTGVLELVAFIETTFGSAMADADIVPDNLDSIRSLAAYVERKRPAASAAA
jgi:acyl carrier protein